MASIFYLLTAESAEVAEKEIKMKVKSQDGKAE